MDHIVTLVAAPAAARLRSGLVAEIRGMVRGGEPRILSEDEAVDIPCADAPDLEALLAVLAGEAVDVGAGPAGDRRKAVLVADMDSTIVRSETLDDLAAEAGCGDRVAEITRRSMNGEIDFAEALRQRVAMLRGVSVDLLERVWSGVRLMPGARTLVATMRAHGARTALASGGFTVFTGRVAALCGFDEHHANELLLDGGALSGAVREPILDRDAKRARLRRVCAARGVAVEAALAVGDGANDLAMLAEAGMGVAYHAKPLVARAARWRVDHGDLRALLFFQGYRRVDFLNDTDQAA